jgi:hypothetical protein
MKAVEFIRRAIKRSSDKEEEMLIMRDEDLDRIMELAELLEDFNMEVHALTSKANTISGF